MDKYYKELEHYSVLRNVMLQNMDDVYEILDAVKVPQNLETQVGGTTEQLSRNYRNIQIYLQDPERFNFRSWKDVYQYDLQGVALEIKTHIDRQRRGGTLWGGRMTEPPEEPEEVENPAVLTPEQQWEEQQAAQQAQYELDWTLNALANHQYNLENYAIPMIRTPDDTDEIVRVLALPDLPDQYDVDMFYVSPLYQQFDEDTGDYTYGDAIDYDTGMKLRADAEEARDAIIQWIKERIAELTPPSPEPIA